MAAQLAAVLPEPHGPNLVRPGSRRSLPQAVLAGAAAGLAGAWTMAQFAALWNAASGNPQHGSFSGSPQEREATLNLAAQLGKKLLGNTLSGREQELGAAALHYLNGAALGALYSVIAELVPAVIWGRGAAFGAFFWYFGDEVGLPALGLLRPSREYSRSARLNALGEHVVFGVTTDLVRRMLRRSR